MSRRARSRLDKREVRFDVDAPDIERAFARLTAERRDTCGDEGTSLTLKDGSTVDLAAPWPLPTTTQRTNAQ